MKIRDSKGNVASSSHVSSAKRLAAEDRQRQRGLALGFCKFTGAVATVAMLVYFATVSGLEGTSQPVQDQELFASVKPKAQTEQATATATNHRARKGKEEAIVEVVDLTVATPAPQQEVVYQYYFVDPPYKAGEEKSNSYIENGEEEKVYDDWYKKHYHRNKLRPRDSSNAFAWKNKDGHWQ